jgi:hypothetical protein
LPETETPFAAATVVLHVGEVVAAVTRTGVDGVYRFTGLKPAVYGVGRDIWDKVAASRSGKRKQEASRLRKLKSDRRRLPARDWAFA